VPSLLAKIIFWLSLIYVIPMGIGYLFAFSGSHPGPIFFMAAGHTLVLIFSHLAKKNSKMFVGVAVGVVCMIGGYWFDKNFWKRENESLCQQLKSDPLCVESETGFTCSQLSRLGGFSVGKGICK
jgi:hypothetical protein